MDCFLVKVLSFNVYKTRTKRENFAKKLLGVESKAIELSFSKQVRLHNSRAMNPCVYD